MISRLVLAIVVGVVTTLICIFLGGIFTNMGISWVVSTGEFLETYGPLLGLLAALWYGFWGYRRFTPIN